MDTKNARWTKANYQFFGLNIIDRRISIIQKNLKLLAIIIQSSIDRLLPSGSVVRDVSILAGSTTIAQVLNLAITPILSRLYSPSDFGTMSVFVSVVTILSEFSGLRYQLAIPLPKERHYAIALMVLSFILQAAFAIFISLVFLVAGKEILMTISLEVLVPYLFLIPIGIAGISVYLTLTRWAVREKLFPTLARTRLHQSISGSITKIVLGIVGLKPLGLLIGSIIGSAGGITTLLRAIGKKDFPSQPKKEDIKKVAFRYRSFPFYGIGTGLLNALGERIIPILLVAFYDANLAGLYAMAQSLLHVPAAFVGQAIGQVFVQRASTALHEGSLKDISLKTYSIVLRLGLFPILLISFFAPPVFSFVLGPRWFEAGYYAMVLGPWLAFNFVYSPMAVIFEVVDRQGVRLAIDVVQLPIKLAAFWFGSKMGGALLAAGLFGGIGFVVLFLKMFYLLLVSGNSAKTIWRESFLIYLEAFLLLIIPVGGLFLGWRWEMVFVALIFSIIFFLIKSLSSLKQMNKIK